MRSSPQRFIRKYKLEDEKITLYKFRCIFATILLEERENPRIVADMMGHEKVSTILDLYSHVVSNTVYKQTAQTLDGVYERLTKKAVRQVDQELVGLLNLRPSKIDSNADNLSNFRGENVELLTGFEPVTSSLPIP